MLNTFAAAVPDMPSLAWTAASLALTVSKPDVVSQEAPSQDGPFGFTMRPCDQSDDARPIPHRAPRRSGYEQNEECGIITCAETIAEVCKDSAKADNDIEVLLIGATAESTQGREDRSRQSKNSPESITHSGGLQLSDDQTSRAVQLLGWLDKKRRSLFLEIEAHPYRTAFLVAGLTLAFTAGQVAVLPCLELMGFGAIGPLLDSYAATYQSTEGATPAFSYAQGAAMGSDNLPVLQNAASAGAMGVTGGGNVLSWRSRKSDKEKEDSPQESCPWDTDLMLMQQPMCPA